MERRVVPKKRIGSTYGDIGMSMRKRHIKETYKTLNAAERSFCGGAKVSLCGTNPEMTESFYGGEDEKKENKNRKEARKNKEEGRRMKEEGTSKTKAKQN